MLKLILNLAKGYRINSFKIPESTDRYNFHHSICNSNSIIS